jgi:two-component system sensor histidine kinase KdpD
LIVEETQKLYKSLLDCVSHELKTPLAAIKGSASALLDAKTNSNKAAIEQLSTEILHASERLQRLVENLLDMTRIESGMLKAKRERCDVEDLVGAVLPRIELSRGLHNIKVTIPPKLPPVVCDPVLIDQALVNILHNAFVYTPENSEIEVRAVDSRENMLEIQVRDHGPGLPKDNPEKVLEKFYRAAPQKAGGVGLGLSIAKGFIEAQGGKLHAHNEKDGAVFSIFLPKGSYA